MVHNHSFHNEKNRKSKRFFIIIILNLLISFVEIAAGVISGSLALISDAFHNFQDTLSVVITFLAWRLSFKTPTESKTYGYKRAEIIAAFVNSIFLISLSIFIIAEAIKRFYKPHVIDDFLMISMAFFAFVANIISAFMLHKDSFHNINFKSAYLHMLGDAFFSLIVIVGAFSIGRWNIYWIDPLLSVGMSFFIIYQSLPILLKSFNILMQSAPALNYDKIKQDIEKVAGVKNIHHVHCWLNNEETVYFEAHVEIEDCMVSKSCEISFEVEKILKEKYGIYHTTLQFETDRCKRKEMFYI
ncbi:MAG: cation diffusion facilitator family transporter [Elusimicrobiota bacterium]